MSLLDLQKGAGHFGHKTLRHHKIVAEVYGYFGTKALRHFGTEFKKNNQLCLVGIVLGPKCPDFSAIQYIPVPKCLATLLQHRRQNVSCESEMSSCQSVLWSKCRLSGYYNCDSTAIRLRFGFDSTPTQCRINHGSGGSPEPGPLNSGAS